MIGLLLLGLAWADGPADWNAPALSAASVTVPANALGDAVRTLSHYPPGQIPIEPATIYAISVVAQHGGRGEISLLRNLVENERDEIKDAAMHAVSRIRDRQVDTQRDDFARTLPNWRELHESAQPFRQAGMGREEARCAGYASLILGDRPMEAVEPRPGKPRLLLAQGMPRKAIAAARHTSSPQARLVEARGREELGDVRGALQVYAWLAATGHQDAARAIDGYGIDTERLLLGVLVQGAGPVELRGHEVLSLLIRNGDHLTVSVLAERTRANEEDAAMEAAHALGEMLEGRNRSVPLASPSERVALKALSVASQKGPERVREFAQDLLERD